MASVAIVVAAIVGVSVLSKSVVVIVVGENIDVLKQDEVSNKFIYSVMRKKLYGK